MKNFLLNAQAVIVFAGCTVNTIVGVVPIVILAIVKLLLPINSVQTVIARWIMRIGEWWISGNAIIFGIVNSTVWDVRGLAGLSNERWYLVIANHQTWVDIIALQTILNRRIPFLKFFIKHELIWFPFLGVAWWAMDMPFMKRYSKSYLAKHPDKKGQDLKATRAACQKFRATPTTVINFIEGTRFSEQKRLRRASKFKYLLPPRAGGIALSLSSMGDMFDAILDITIAYPGGNPPKFWQMCRGEFRRVVIDVRQRPIEEWMLAGDYAGDREFRAHFHQWLTSIWVEKDAHIGSLLADSAD